MTSSLRRSLLLGLLVWLGACADGDPATDALTDSAADATADPGSDAASDLGAEAEAATDAGADGTADATADATADGTADAETAPDSQPEIGGDPDADAVSGPDAVVGPDAVSGPDAVTALSCFAGQLGKLPGMPVDYDSYGPTIGAHCKGTNHQEIQGVERVVFAGDSITVGTPPQGFETWYRNVMAAGLVARFGLTAPDWLWQNVDLINGVALAQSSGDFWSCAKWGARTDDLERKPHEQLVACNPKGVREKTTLVIITAGGNDIFAWAQDLVKGVPLEDLWAAAEKAAADLESAIHWLVDDPTRFPNGVYVIFANPYEFTDPDSGNDLAKCPGANLISMDTALIDAQFNEITTWFMGEYMRVAVETGTDLAFMGEQTCGHGHMKDDPKGRCYRGPGTELWMDITCLHPSAAGHAGIADLFLSIIDE
jgi:lysophospholipase L1-like esterase